MLALVPVVGLATAQDTLSYFDFDGDLQGWTAVDASASASGDLWAWSAAGPAGPFPIAAINSSTADNGFALFDSDRLCSDDQDALLVSPMFDLTGEAEVELRWQDRYARFEDIITLGVSTDGGATYAESVLYPELEANDFDGANPQVRRFDVSDLAAGRDSVVFAYRFRGGCDYAWMIDDVALARSVTPAPANDLALSQNLFAIAPNFSTPSDFAEGQAFFPRVEVANVGSAAQDTLTVVFELFDDGGTRVYADSVASGGLAPEESIVIDAFAQPMTPPREPGAYTGVYTVRGAAREDSSTIIDNSLAFEFEVTEHDFAKAREVNDGVRPRLGADAYELGNVYYTPGLDDAGGLTIDSVTVGFFLDGLDDNTGTTVVRVLTYGYRGDLDGDGVPSKGAAGDMTAELEPLGEAVLEYDANSPDRGEIVTRVAAAGAAGSVELGDGQGYIGFVVALNYEAAAGASAGDDEFLVGSDRAFDYLGYTLAASEAGSPARYGSVYFPGGGAVGEYDFVRDGLFIGATLGVDVAVEEQLGAGSLRAYPNPTTGRFQVELVDRVGGDLAEVLVTDALGREVLRLAVVRSPNAVIDLGNSPAGLYQVRAARSDGRYRVMRVMLAR